jgi:succinoglycan biosynthesis protein ExoA
MPALNEERYIQNAIHSVLPSSDAIEYELLVMDGGSTDRTCAIVAALATSNPRIRLLKNLRRTQSAAMNVASELCHPRSTILLRADCHAIYPSRFAERCVEAMQRWKSSSVVVSMRADGLSQLQRAIAAAQNSRLGNGGSPHRGADQSGFVDHGHHAAFDREAFRSLGGYDETAICNEDAEFDVRLRRSGRSIYLDGNLIITYYPRSSFSALALQYYRHGRGRARTLLKHAVRPKARQILPVLLFLLCAASLATWPISGWLSLMLPSAYLAICLIWGLAIAVRQRNSIAILSGPAFVTMHLSWAAGFLKQVGEDWSALRRRLREIPARAT